ncbi:hypothetical protein AB0N60_34890 [Streptomyces microflavus]|uniref:RICIN domain-containing protein n=1 Tax=Streptomyces microflavus TaxID=1919 RepID=UPI0034148DC2
MVNLQNFAAAMAFGICTSVLTGAAVSAQAPEVYEFQNLSSHLLGNSGTELGAPDGETRAQWVLKTPAGAAPEVYQIQLKGTNWCIKAESKSYAHLVDCAANPGKPQRWKLNPAEGQPTTIASRMYPGHVLTTGGAEDQNVTLEPRDPSKYDGQQEWYPYRQDR